MNRKLSRAGAIAIAGFVLVSGLGRATETAAATNPAYDVLVRTKPSDPNTFMIRNIFVMGGEDLNKFPYIEHSDSPFNGNIQGINFVIPDKSTFGWRFFTRVTEVPVPNATLRATIDAYGNATFTGAVTGGRFAAGFPGVYTPSALVWGNRLGGDSITTLFSSDTQTVQSVAATVFGMSYHATPVIAQDAFGNLGVLGDTTTKALTAKTYVAAASVKVAGATITSGSSAPAAACAAGDLYLRTGGGAGSTAYSCAASKTWAALSAARTDAPAAPSAALPSPILAQAAFRDRSLEAAPVSTNLATVSATLGTSSGKAARWYVCALVEGNTLAIGQIPDRTMINAGIGTANAGSGAAFRMFSRPDIEANDAALATSVVSDWLATPTGTLDGRYCNTYSNGEAISFTAYALPTTAVRSNAIYTSGQIEIQAFPQ